MPNHQRNCILWICCPPYSEESVKALAEELAEAESQFGVASSYEGIARWVMKNFDLAPAGSLQAFKDEIARLAREGHVKAEPAFNDPGD